MRVGVVARCDIDEAVELSSEIVDFLMENDVETFIDTPLVDELKKYKAQYTELSCELGDMDVDMVIAVGGDGTILRTQSFVNKKKIPIFGINMLKGSTPQFLRLKSS